MVAEALKATSTNIPAPIEMTSFFWGRPQQSKGRTQKRYNTSATLSINSYWK